MQSKENLFILRNKSQQQLYLGSLYSRDESLNIKIKINKNTHQNALKWYGGSITHSCPHSCRESRDSFLTQILIPTSVLYEKLKIAKKISLCFVWYTLRYKWHKNTKKTKYCVKCGLFRLIRTTPTAHTWYLSAVTHGNV